MKADKINLLTELLGFNRRQFCIPVYQRKYKWTSEQCNRLIDDLIIAGKMQREHFTGTVVYQEPNSGSFKKAYLVDGQQRVTTVLLMVKALNIICGAKKDLDSDYQYVYDSTSGYLLADDKDIRRGMKLIPSKNDENTFQHIMNAKTFEEIEKNPLISKTEEDNLFNNFKTIYERFVKLDTSAEYLRNTVFEGMLLLTIVEMSLDKDDDPQAIFESINSLGLKLSNADLIRNYLLMSHDKQKELYENYWEVIQDEFVGENNMESFVFNYLMMKRSYAINNEDIYKEYVLYANELYKGVEINKEEMLIDLYNVAKIYQPFIKNSLSYSADTNMLMQELRDMVQTTAYPFLMKVFLDKESNIIDENTLDKVINLIIVYLVRRTVCGVPTNTLRGFMLNLYNRVFKVAKNKERYFDAIYAFLNQLESKDRLRNRVEFSDSLLTAEIYKNVKFATYLLYKIENGRYPNVYTEFTLANNISVEHIMPQTLTDEWISMLGDNFEEIHKTYLNTLGNLSLSSRSKNSIMSNESFVDKRDVLLSSGSKFIELNKDIVADQTEFGLTEILAREERLSEIVCSKYDIDDIDVSGIKFENTIEIICSTDYEEVFESSTPVSMKLFDNEIPVDSFSKIIVNVAKVLLDKYPEKMRDLAANKFNPWDDGEKDLIHYSYPEKDNDKLVGENIRVHTGYSSGYCIQFATLLMKEFGIEDSQLVVYLKKESVKSENVLPKKRRIEIVRKALEELKNEDLVIYDYLSMPKSDDFIKFQTKELNEIFKFDGHTVWDGEQYSCICYLEYSLSQNAIYMTFKSMKKTESITNKLVQFSNDLSITTKIIGNFWRLKKYIIDFNQINIASNKILEMKGQIKKALVNIKDDLSLIKERLKD